MKKMSIYVFLFLMLGAMASSTQTPQQGAKAKPAVQKKKVALEFVSAYWIFSARTTLNSISWRETDEEKGLVVILKRSSNDQLVIHSNDFSLAFESESDIPRRPCMGISYGMNSPTEEIVWGILGSLCRYWIKPDKPYFALLFPAPKKIGVFSLQRAAPLMANFKVSEK